MNITANELLAELADEFAEPEIPDGAVTIRMLMDKTGKCEQTCARLLKKKVRSGELGVVRVKITDWYYKNGGEID